MPKLSFLAPFALLLALACGGGSYPSNPGDSNPPPPPPPVQTTIPGKFRPLKAQTATVKGSVAASTISSTVSMTTPRIYHSAVKLLNGDLMIVGGLGGNGANLTATEIFSAGGENFTFTGNMANPRVRPGVARLPNGNVVVIGGCNVNAPFPFGIDVWDGSSWSMVTCEAIDQRGSDTINLNPVAYGFPNGKILFYGGVVGFGANMRPRDPILIDTNETPWQTTVISDNPVHHRSHFASLRLQDGRIMITGGSLDSFGGDNSVIIYDPEAENFSVFQMVVGRSNHGMIQHPDGKVQIYGGVHGGGPDGNPVLETSVETFNLTTGQSVLAGNLRRGAGLMGSNLLQNGETLHGGGAGPDGKATADQVTYNYNTNVSLFTSQMVVPRLYSVSMTLNSGRVVYIGGNDGLHVLDSAEIFDSYSAIMMNTPSDTMVLSTTTPSTMQMQLISGGPVNWSCTNGVGTIDSNGLYTAPVYDSAHPSQNPTFVVITATSQSDPTNKVKVTISLTPPPQ